jgi:glycosyltransferase involved in cell wall biosynthesis
MKICIVCSGYSNNCDGVTNLFEGLSEQWARQGHQVNIITGRGEKSASRGVKVFRFPFIRAKYFRRKPFLMDELEGFTLIPSAIICLIATKPDVVLSVTNAETLPSIVLRYPSIMIDQPFLKGRFRMCKKAGLVMANNPLSFRIFRHLGLNVEFINPGIKIENQICTKNNIASEEIPLEGFVILTVARLHPQKRIHLLIDAFKMIKQKATLLVIGGGPELAKLRSMITPNMTNRIIFLGDIPHDQVFKFYQLCDVFTLPDQLVFGEWFATVLVEAILMGKPVVTTYSKTRAEWLSPFAFFTNVENPSEYSEALKAAANKKIDMSSVEFSAFKDRFDFEHYSLKFIKVFAGVLHERGLNKNGFVTALS